VTNIVERPGARRRDLAGPNHAWVAAWLRSSTRPGGGATGGPEGLGRLLTGVLPARQRAIVTRSACLPYRLVSSFEEPLMHALLLVALSVAPTPSTPDRYPLDDVVRAIAATGPARCPQVPLITYRGTKVRYDHPARVHPAFAERLRMFEDVVAEVGREQFGRAPVLLKHAGTYSCRRISGYPTLLSEHGIGNGIDVVAFSFPRASRRQASELPASLRGPFQVSLADFQAQPTTPRARFLDTLARRLIGRRDIFRVLLGPAYPGHKGHFHFDVAPYRVVSIWTPDDDTPAAPQTRETF
jgi:hypothetical protein